MNNYHEKLGVSKEATKAEIDKAYRNLAKKYHPDKYAQDPIKMKSAEVSMQNLNLLKETIDSITEKKLIKEKANTSPEVLQKIANINQQTKHSFDQLKQKLIEANSLLQQTIENSEELKEALDYNVAKYKFEKDQIQFNHNHKIAIAKGKGF